MNGLEELGLPVGPWLRELKQAVIANRPDDNPIRIGASGNREMPLGLLRDTVKVAAGQKISYVTDVANTADYRAAIIELVRSADLLFIEAAFAQTDAPPATSKRGGDWNAVTSLSSLA